MKVLLMIVKDVPSFWVSKVLIWHAGCLSTVDLRWILNSNRPLSQDYSDGEKSSACDDVSGIVDL